MTLARSVVVPGVLDEYRAFGDLIGSLSGEQWEAPSRCEGWSVADVAGHVVGQLADVTALRLDGLGSPEATARQALERRGRTPGDLVDELESCTKTASDLLSGFDDAAWATEGPQGNGQTLGFGVEALWFDTFVHAGDIRVPLSLEGTSPSALAPSVSHISQVLTEQGWGPATIRLTGLQEFQVSGGDSARVITGDPLQFILVSTGRSDPRSMGLDASVNIYR